MFKINLPFWYKKILGKKVLNYILFAISVLIIIYLFADFYGPKRIKLKNATAFGFQCMKAPELIVQEYDKNDNLWATRGMLIYQLKKGDSEFRKITHVPTGFSVFWLRNFSIIRKLTIRPECIEMVVTPRGDICAISAGWVWLMRYGEKKFHKTLRLSNYGFGDQGVRNDGIVCINDSIIYLGEYFQNPNRNEVKIIKSINHLTSWEEAYEFQPGQIRHIHAVQEDPYSKKIWICTGDMDIESQIAWSNDGCKNIQRIGGGRQLWRVCQLVFTKNDIYWGADTGSEEDSGIYKWNKKTAKLKKLLTIDGAIFYGTQLKNGTIIMSSDREGMKSEIDNRTRLYIFSKQDKIATTKFGTWNHKRPGFWFKHGKLRFQRNQGGAALAITCLNLKEFPDGELLIISEKKLRSVFKNPDGNFEALKIFSTK